jgi:hypothetical protein
MQNAVADQRVQADTLGATTTISLRDTVSGSTGQVRSGIEVIPENPSSSGPIKDLHAVFCRDLLEFLGDFRSAAPKSSSVRRLGQAAVAQGPPATRDPAPHQDILFDFLRAFEAAPKMRPLSHMGVGRVAPGTAGTSAGSIDVPAIEPQAEDTPFRVPPYVSAVSENTAGDEALLDVDEVWLEPQPSPAPVAKRPTRPPVAKRQSPAPVAKGPAQAPVVKQSGAVTVIEKPAPDAVAKDPAPMTVLEEPAPVVPAASPAVASPAVASPAIVTPAPLVAAKRADVKPASAQAKKRPETRPAPAPAVKPLGPAAARAKAIEEGLIVEISPPARSTSTAQQPGPGSGKHR